MTQHWVQHSQAVLAASVLVARADTSAVRRRLERQGLSIWPAAEDAGSHPVIIELWRVERGQLALGGKALEDVWAAAGTAAWAAPALLFGSRERLKRAADSGARAGRAVADALIDRWGSYHELLVSIPDVRAPDLTEPCQLVLGMYTDSALSKRGAEWLGYGYGKRLADFQRCDFATFSTRVPDDGRSLRARFAPSSGSSQLLASVSELAQLRAWLSQPLLGLHGGARALSRLTRDYATQIRPACGSLELDLELSAELLTGTQPLLGFQSGFHAPALPVQLSFPRAAARWT
ncbi:MAG TPA: hypothetical protein VJV78_41745 [Polyangiales bacterium]|nr:hypothetical protein [Polyangiales bacterium]